ncbi:hypothetical protein Cni_G29226 [Canna indica]|uniref:Uncharacterized protein n=1 Tax=Canna indica TaxID=4628 RepID=A0AAQ3QPF2_9LILI|nr:hypothetical protein Cni_G29226 [Canna indica]
MAHRTPAAIRNENAHIHIGKDIDQVKSALPKPAKAGRKDRKALKDLSNTGNPPVSGPSKASALKEKNVLRGRETTTNFKICTKNNLLTDEEIKKCHEWAKEGIEHAYFTGNDQQKLRKDSEEKRVNKKVQKALLNLEEWLTISYKNPRLLNKELCEDTQGFKKMELEEEMLPPSWLSKDTSGHKEMVSFHESESEVDVLSLLEDSVDFNLELKED